MYARVTLLEIDVVRMSMSDALARFEADTLPRVREQPGYRGVSVFTTSEGKGMLVSLWETEAQASTADGGFYSDQLSRFAKLFRSPPGRECYEVSFVDQPVRLG